MPASRVSEGDRIPALAVVGTYRGEDTAVRHVGLLESESIINPMSVYRVYHSGPPLQLGQPDDSGKPALGEMGASTSAGPISVAGWIEPLDKVESRKIRVWLSQQKTLQPLGFAAYAQYIALPHVLDVLDSVSGHLKFRRFSCVGLVCCCYAEALGRILVDLNQLPSVPLSVIESVWDNVAGMQPAVRAKFAGLQGEGPWPLLLPGYLLRALSRSKLEPPYVPTVGDIQFP